MVNQAPQNDRLSATVILCVVTAILEGLDIQSIGVAAPKLLPEYGLNAAQAGYLFSSSIVGLFFGAFIGGALSDRLGRKWILVASVGLFGLFSLLTPAAPDLKTLIAMRCLTGVGLGGAMPNLLVLLSEYAPQRWKTQWATAICAGMPLGGLLAAQIAAMPHTDWRMIFVAGGLPALLVALLMAFMLPGPLPDRTEQPSARPETQGWRIALGGDRRSVPTAMLWISHFFTLLILYLLLNWLPTLMAVRGFSRSDAALSSAAYNVGAVLGALSLALLLEILSRRMILLLVYAGMAGGLVGLALASLSLTQALIFAAISGFFVIGGQYVLYGITPNFYPARFRGRGVGAAIAVGRLGGIVGPIMAGQLLVAGYPIPHLLLSLLLLVLVAALAILTAAAAFPEANPAHSLSSSGVR
jgi:AAHS family 3-hydroxyphenylpropionic acid transporter